MKILRRNFLRTFLVTPFLGFFNGRKLDPPTSLELPDPPYPYAFGETYSKAGIELQVCIDPYGVGWKTIQHMQIGQIYHVEQQEFQEYRHLRMVVTNVDLNGGVITLAGVNDGNDAKQLDPYPHGVSAFTWIEV